MLANNNIREEAVGVESEGPLGCEMLRFEIKRIAIVAAPVLAVWLIVLFALFPDAGSLLAAYWVIVPVAFLAASFANATAVGGGFLFVPLFIFVYGLAPLAALKLSIATQAFGMSSGAFGWSRKYIVGRALMTGGLSSLLGMFIGSYMLVVPPEMIKPLFGWVSIMIFVIIVLEIKFGSKSHDDQIHNDSWLKSSLFSVFCLLGGMLTAWTAIGVGEVVALYLLYVYRIRIESAIGTGVAVLALNSIAGLLFHSHIGGIPWEYLIFTVPGVLVGGFFGARLGRALEVVVTEKQNKGMTALCATPNHQSPLKWLFASIIIIDGTAMLLHGYL